MNIMSNTNRQRDNSQNNKYYTQLSPSDINKPESKTMRDVQSQTLPSRDMGLFQPAEPPYTGSRNQTQNQSPMRQMPERMPMMPTQPRTPATSPPAAIPETLVNTAFLPAYLSEQIGKWMRIEFLIGNQLTDRVGKLIEVGASYIVLQLLDPNSTLLCDLFSIKFVTIIRDEHFESLVSR